MAGPPLDKMTMPPNILEKKKKEKKKERYPYYETCRSF